MNLRLITNLKKKVRMILSKKYLKRQGLDGSGNSLTSVTATFL